MYVWHNYMNSINIVSAGTMFVLEEWEDRSDRSKGIKVLGVMQNEEEVHEFLDFSHEVDCFLCDNNIKY